MSTIEFASQNDFIIDNENAYTNWLIEIANKEGYEVSELTYVFCDDDYLLDINQRYLDHDTYTDIITFDYVEDRDIKGEIYISIDRITENANTFEVSFYTELKRVLAHGMLHLCGYGDKSPSEIQLMRKKENEAVNSFVD